MRIMPTECYKNKVFYMDKITHKPERKDVGDSKCVWQEFTINCIRLCRHKR